MYLLNLTLFQFAAIFGTVSAVSIALYLLDRARRRQVVSTLRFWAAAEKSVVAARRRRISQPWSLILQLVSMALLVLALAQLRWGTRAEAGRDHILILDTSAWMAARSGQGTLMDLARQRARQYLRVLPARDRVMLVRADALATPATPFEPDRRKLNAAIAQSAPGATALNLDQALAFARHVESQADRRPGEIVLVGTGRIAERDPVPAPEPPRNLRVITVPDAPDNCGLRKIGVRRAASDPDTWEIYVSARNYGTAARTVTLTAAFNRVAIGTARLALGSGVEKEAAFTLRAAAGGVLNVELAPDDAYPGDNHAELEIPAQPNLAVTVYSSEPDLLRPVLAASPRIAATYRSPVEYASSPNTGLVILDRFIPPTRPAADSLWIDPPAMGSPIPIRETVASVPFAGWNPDHPAAHGLRAKDFKLDHASVFEAAPGDGRIGEVASGPVIVSRSSHPKVVAIGFHPALSGMRNELATPLLFANLLRWFSPDILRHSEVDAATVGTVKVPLDPDAPAGDVKVVAQNGEPVPFTVRDRIVQFFSGAPGSVRVIAGDREYLYSLTLPQLWDARWTPPAGALRGIPRFTPVADSVSELWPWLALMGGAGLVAEWLMFGRFRRARVSCPLLLSRNFEREKTEVRQ
jgi:hypothetical protein